MKKFFFLLLLLAFKVSFAQEGGTNGTVTTDVSGTSDYLAKMVFQEDGKLVAIGTIGATMRSFVVVRYNLEGSLDQSFGNKGIAITKIGENDFATGIAIQKDGKIVVVGSTLSNNSQSFAVVRYNSDGSLDTTFDEDGIATTHLENVTLADGTFVPSLSMSAYAVALQRDDKIVVGGLAAFYRGQQLYAMVRYNVDGGLDHSFGNSGSVIIKSGSNGGVINAIAIQSDNKIVAAGDFYIPYFASDYALLRFNSDGTLDNSFGTDGIITINKAREDNFNAVLLQPDGKIVLGGASSTAFNIYSLFRFNTDGTADHSFNNTGVIYGPGDFFNNVPEGVVATALQNDGKIVALSENGFVMRFNNNGTMDSTFYDNGQKKISFDGKAGRSTALKLNGNYIYVGGYVNNGSSETPDYDFAITRLDNPTNISFTCPASVTVNNDKESCGAVINNISPVFGEGAAETNFALTGATNSTGIGDASGTQFNKGVTTVTYSLKDNPANTCSFTVTVDDAEAPVINGLSTNITTLWPPNHKMHTISLAYDSKDNCGVGSCNVTVTSNELTGHTPDWTIINDHEISLRAERNSDGNGRIYTIKVVCTDDAGNESAPVTTIITVPRSRRDFGKRIGGESEFDIDEIDERGTLIVNASPNPSTNNFTISIRQADKFIPVSLKIYDLAGRVVESKNGIENRTTITAGAKLHAGVYFAEIIQGGQKQILKLIKK